MVKIILIKSPDEWTTTKEAFRDELAVYLSFSSYNIYIALLLCIEHCFTKVKILHFIYIYLDTEKFLWSKCLREMLFESLRSNAYNDLPSLIWARFSLWVTACHTSFTVHHLQNNRKKVYFDSIH